MLISVMFPWSVAESGVLVAVTVTRVPEHLLFLLVKTIFSSRPKLHMLGKRMVVDYLV